MGGWLTSFLTRGVARGETKDEGKLWVEGLGVGWLRGSAPSACPSFLGPCQAQPYLLGLLPSAPTPSLLFPGGPCQPRLSVLAEAGSLPLGSHSLAPGLRQGWASPSQS